MTEICAAEVPTETDGLNLLPTLTGVGVQAKHEALYWEHGGKQALRAGMWKLVRNGIKQPNPKTELFDLEQDPGETKNLAQSEPEVLARMLALAGASRTPSPVFTQSMLDH